MFFGLIHTYMDEIIFLNRPANVLLQSLSLGGGLRSLNEVSAIPPSSHRAPGSAAARRAADRSRRSTVAGARRHELSAQDKNIPRAINARRRPGALQQPVQLPSRWLQTSPPSTWSERTS